MDKLSRGIFLCKKKGYVIEAASVLKNYIGLNRLLNVYQNIMEYLTDYDTIVNNKEKRFYLE